MAVTPLNEQRQIPSSPRAEWTRGSHKTFTSCSRSVRYTVSRSCPSPGWQPTSVIPGGNSASRLISASTEIHRSEEHTSELQSPCNLVCRLLLEKKKKRNII